MNSRTSTRSPNKYPISKLGETEELVNFIQSIDSDEFRFFSPQFIRFLTLNLPSIARLFLDDQNRYDDSFYTKALKIFSSQNQEIRRLFISDKSFISLIEEYPKRTHLTPIRGLYIRILDSLILESEFDFLGSIFQPQKFMCALLNNVHYLTFFDFLLRFFNSKRQTILRFFEIVKLPELLLQYFPITNTERILLLLETLIKSLTHTPNLRDPLLQPMAIESIVDAAISSQDDGIAQAAFKVLIALFSYNQNICSMRQLGNYICASQRFSKSHESAVNLFILILKGKDSASDELDKNTESSARALKDSNMLFQYGSDEQLAPDSTPSSPISLVELATSQIPQSSPILSIVDNSHAESPLKSRSHPIIELPPLYEFDNASEENILSQQCESPITNDNNRCSHSLPTYTDCLLDTIIEDEEDDFIISRSCQSADTFSIPKFESSSSPDEECNSPIAPDFQIEEEQLSPIVPIQEEQEEDAFQITMPSLPQETIISRNPELPSPSIERLAAETQSFSARVRKNHRSIGRLTIPPKEEPSDMPSLLDLARSPIQDIEPVFTPRPRSFSLNLNDDYFALPIPRPISTPSEVFVDCMPASDRGQAGSVPVFKQTPKLFHSCSSSGEMMPQRSLESMHHEVIDLDIVTNVVMHLFSLHQKMQNHTFLQLTIIRLLEAIDESSVLENIMKRVNIEKCLKNANMLTKRFYQEIAIVGIEFISPELREQIENESNEQSYGGDLPEIPNEGQSRILKSDLI